MKPTKRKQKPITHPGLHRAVLSCRIAREAIEKQTAPALATPMEYAVYNLAHAIEEIAEAMMKDNPAPRG
jgi:hypothetical protein